MSSFVIQIVVLLENLDNLGRFYQQNVVFLFRHIQHGLYPWYLHLKNHGFVKPNYTQGREIVNYQHLQMKNQIYQK